MAIIPEIADKLAQYIDDVFDKLKDTAERLFPDLPPAEQKKSAFLQTTNLHTSCVVRSGLNMCGTAPLHQNMIQACLFKFDFTMTKDGFYVGDMTNMGKINGTNWNRLNQQEIEYVENDLIVPWTTPQHYSINKLQDGTLSAKISVSSTNRITLGVYDGSNVFHADWVNQTFLTTWDTTWQSGTWLDIAYNVLEYTTADGYITVSFAETGWSINNLYPNSSTIFGLKSYPFVGNFKDQTFINRYITDNGATNNYHTTYTTQSNKNIEVYYGDNYIIYYTQDDEPVSYDDVRNAFNIAIDQINDDNDTNIPPAPPYAPEPEPLESDNQEDGGNYNHAEFTKVYACTSEELNNLYQWMGGGAAGTSGTSPVTVPDSFDPMNRIVGLIGYPMIIDTGVGDETTFTFRNAANQTINTGWSTYKYGNFDRAVDFGTVEIPNWEEVNNGAPFLDYAATVEIYIPFCGIVGLDPQSVMGCTLSCKMWIDFVTGDCSAVVYTNYGGEDAQHPVAFVSGNCGSAEVVSANAFGAYQGAKAQASHKMSQAILGGVKNLATSIIGGATTGFTRGAANPSGTGGNAGMKAGAIGSVIGGAMDLGVNLTLQNLDNQYAVQVAKNALGTTISGSFGQQTSWYYMDTPYIKVTWPTPISKDVELYGKTFGVPVHRSGLLNEFTGYTVCNNVDVSGIVGATASELAMIKQFLETGVFIKEGGEE